MLKPEIRIIAWDDCAFTFKTKSVRIVGVVYRGGSFLDGLLSTMIKKDGMDVTEKMAESIMRSRHYEQLSYIMLNGISYAGFNLADIKKLYRKTKLPVVAVQRKKPDIRKFREAMRICGGIKDSTHTGGAKLHHVFDDYKKRLQAVKNAGRVHEFKAGKIFYQKHGMNNSECEQVLKITCIRSNVPEPLRVAHLIASGLSRMTYKDASVRFESRGRA